MSNSQTFSPLTSINSSVPSNDAEEKNFGPLDATVQADGAVEDGRRTSVEPEYPGPKRLGLIVLAVTLCIFLGALDLTIVSTAIPSITDEFHSLDQVSKSSRPRRPVRFPRP